MTGPARSSLAPRAPTGERVRVVEPRGGRVLAEVEAGPGLVDLQADAKLNLYLLTDAGTLTCYRLASHFAVVA